MIYFKKFCGHKFVKPLVQTSLMIFRTQKDHSSKRIFKVKPTPQSLRKCDKRRNKPKLKIRALAMLPAATYCNQQYPEEQAPKRPGSRRIRSSSSNDPICVVIRLTLVLRSANSAYQPLASCTCLVLCVFTFHQVAMSLGVSNEFLGGLAVFYGHRKSRLWRQDHRLSLNRVICPAILILNRTQLELHL